MRNEDEDDDVNNDHDHHRNLKEVFIIVWGLLDSDDVNNDHDDNKGEDNEMMITLMIINW